MCWFWWRVSQWQVRQESNQGPQSSGGREGVKEREVRRRTEESKQSSKKKVRGKIRVQEERGGVGVDHQFPVYLPPSPPLSPSLPLTPHSFLSHSFSLPLLLSKPVAISDFLGNLRNNTSERAQDPDTHNKPASVTLNPTQKKVFWK